jgi:hypothetical protein
MASQCGQQKTVPEYDSVGPVLAGIGLTFNSTTSSPHFGHLGSSIFFCFVFGLTEIVAPWPNDSSSPAATGQDVERKEEP